MFKAFDNKDMIQCMACQPAMCMLRPLHDVLTSSKCNKLHALLLVAFGR